MKKQSNSNHIIVVREVSAQYRRRKQPSVVITQPADVAAFIRSILPDNSREHFVTLHLDGAHQVVAYSITATGGRISAGFIRVRFSRPRFWSGRLR